MLLLFDKLQRNNAFGYTSKGTSLFFLFLSTRLPYSSLMCSSFFHSDDVGLLIAGITFRAILSSDSFSLATGKTLVRFLFSFPL
jgi:hypothetical protein